MTDFQKRNFGVVLSGHHLAYGWRHGYGQWLPFWLQRVVVVTWNFYSCFWFGHDWFGPILDENNEQIVGRTCSACSKEANEKEGQNNEV